MAVGLEFFFRRCTLVCMGIIGHVYYYIRMSTLKVLPFLGVVMLFLLSTLCSLSRFCMADISEADKLKVSSVLSGLDDSRMRLNSGVCRIVGSSDRGTLENIEDDILVAFDFNKGFYRFDQGINRSLQTQDYYYECLEGAQMVSRYSIQSARHSHLIRPFDIRNLGFFNFQGPYWKERYATNEHIDLFKDNPISIEEVNSVFYLSTP